MTINARRTSLALGCALPWLLGEIACSPAGDGTAGGGDRVSSARAALDAGGGGAGGAGGAGPALPSGPTRICMSDVVILDGLPECFVAEVSSAALDCSAPGHEELRPAWEDAARERECAYRSLNATECAALSLCGLSKLSGTGLVSCRTDDEAPPGYCVVDERSEGCSFAEADSLFVFGVSPEAEALHVSCAVVDVE